jgi:hypothetical protein
MTPKYKTNRDLIKPLAHVMELRTACNDSLYLKVSYRMLEEADDEIYYRVNDAKRPLTDIVYGNHADHPKLNEFLKGCGG